MRFRTRALHGLRWQPCFVLLRVARPPSVRGGLRKIGRRSSPPRLPPHACAKSSGFAFTMRAALRPSPAHARLASALPLRAASPKGSRPPFSRFSVLLPRRSFARPVARARAPFGLAPRAPLERLPGRAAPPLLINVRADVLTQLLERQPFGPFPRSRPPTPPLRRDRALPLDGAGCARPRARRKLRVDHSCSTNN